MLGYGAALFAVGWAVEQRGLSPRLGRWAYPLSLAVYCSSWTFFGGVGTAAGRGWDYLCIYLGPLLVFVLAPGFLRRMIRLARREGSSSVADFISARYGRDRGIAALVAIAALLAAIPYIALQLRSVTLSFGALAGVQGTQLVGPVVAVLLAAFAISFGARRYEVAGRNPSVVGVLAFESLIKLASFVILGVFALWLMLRIPDAITTPQTTRLLDGFRVDALSSDFLVRTLLSATAIFCLPRQFYVGVTEAPGADPIGSGRWPFALYLVLISALMLPLALAGTMLLPGDVPPDLYVLALPLSGGHQSIAMLAFLGGFSAATAMVIAETIALSTMATNDLLAPLLLRGRRAGGEGDLGRLMLRARRFIIVAIIAAALLYGSSVGNDWTLASMGLIAFAGVAQFAPALVATVAWDFRDPRAARAGLIGGLLLWAYCLLLPSVGPGFASGMRDATGGLLNPDALLGLRFGSALVNGTLWSLGANIVLMAAVHYRARPRGHEEERRNVIDHVTTMAELRTLVARFVGEAEADEGFARLVGGPDRSTADAPIDGAAARQAERLIAGVIGAPSARLIVTSSLAGSALDVSDVVRLLDQRGKSLRFSRALLSATLETIDPGVSVIDANLRLVAWNPRYVEMFDYPEGYVVPGRPIADLIRYNALRGDCGPGEVDAHVARRLAHLARGQAHAFERRRPSGRWIKTVGRPMPGGGYVQSFTDITAEKEAQAVLEARVSERTRDLAQSNALLDDARAVAEAATQDKTRFLAAASHDLLQPLHAARLFCTALDERVEPHAREMVRAIAGAIGSADGLLRALLDVSRLDAGGVTPRIERFALATLLDELVTEFRPLAAERGLSLHCHAGHFEVETDRALLRSVLQNFLSNAVRYTPSGRIWVGARRRDGQVRLEVRDTGPGIAEENQARIFAEFERLESRGSAAGGVGLGLAIVRRISLLLDLPVQLRSQPGRGSTFAVCVPLVVAARPQARARPAAPPQSLPPGLRVLALDNDAAVLEALDAALRSRGCVPLLAATAAEALALAEDEEPEVALLDLQLGDGPDGLDVAQALAAMRPAPVIALVTADRHAAEDPRFAALGIRLLAKPVDPDELWRFLADASAKMALAAE